MTVAVGFIPRFGTFEVLSRGATNERPTVSNVREVQASLRDAGRGLRLFRGPKRHGYRREVALRLRGGGFRSGRAGPSGKKLPVPVEGAKRSFHFSDFLFADGRISPGLGHQKNAA